MTISEKAAKLPSWARKILVVASIVAPISGASVTGFKACYEIKAAKKVADQAKVNAAAIQVKADDGYDTLGPAVAEIQKVLNVAMEWSADTDADLDHYGDRLARCEGYMEKLSRRRGFPKLEELEGDTYEEGPWYDTPIASMMPGLPSGTKPKRPAKAIKALRPIPESLNKASDYQQQRVKEHCAPDDPLCGAGGLE
jgi:hypothetical protein